MVSRSFPVGLSYVVRLFIAFLWLHAAGASLRMLCMHYILSFHELTRSSLCLYRWGTTGATQSHQWIWRDVDEQMIYYHAICKLRSHHHQQYKNHALPPRNNTAFWPNLISTSFFFCTSLNFKPMSSVEQYYFFSCSYIVVVPGAVN